MKPGELAILVQTQGEGGTNDETLSGDELFNARRGACTKENHYREGVARLHITLHSWEFSAIQERERKREREIKKAKDGRNQGFFLGERDYSHQRMPHPVYFLTTI